MLSLAEAYVAVTALLKYKKSPRLDVASRDKCAPVANRKLTGTEEIYFIE